MISYKFYRNHNGRLMIQLPKEVTLFEDFIELIATEEEEEEEANELYRLDIIDKVLDGSYEVFEIVLDAPGVIIKPDTTRVYNEYVQNSSL